MEVYRRFPLIEAFIALLFGLLIGSFLNVCIHRWPRGRSVVRPRSHCVRCRKTIVWYDNIPVLSYIVLGGRCRYCGRHISIRYPVVELANGLLWFYWIYTFGVTPLAIKLCLFTSIVIALTFSDLEKRILPDQLTLGGTILGLIFAAFVPVPDVTGQAILWLFGIELPNRARSLLEAAVGAGFPAFFLWGGGWLYQKIRHRDGLGLGDVKLIMMVGSFLGLRGALLTLIIGSISGSIIGLSYIKATGKDSSTYELPFGTFLGAAAIIAVLTGDKMLTWYTGG
jgi:leader peptidase (prepilin peptidase)/N-methyltransferase